MKKNLMILSISLWIGFVTLAAGKNSTETAATQLIQRMVPSVANQFVVKAIPADKKRRCF